jgi:non-ribosomal peptide synthetase component F
VRFSRTCWIEADRRGPALTGLQPGIGRKLDLGPRDVFLQKAPVSFDASVQELFNSLACGGVLLLADPGGERDTQYLARACREQRVTCASFVPSQLDVLLQVCHGPCSFLPPSVAHAGNVCPATGARDGRVHHSAACLGRRRGAAACTCGALC